MRKPLTGILSESWDALTSSLNLDLENISENYLLMINKLKPYIKLLDKIIEEPDSIIAVHPIEIRNKGYSSLIEMGFLKYSSEYESLTITPEGIEMSKSLYDFTHHEARKENRRRKELASSVVKGTF